MIISNLPIDLGRVKQNYSTDNENRPLLMSGVAGVSSTSDRGSNESVVNNSIYANPSTGTIHANISGNISGSSGSCTGNAATATALQTARSINGTSFDGSGNITTANWGTARNVSIQDHNASHISSAVSVDGSGNVTLTLPPVINADINYPITDAEIEAIFNGTSS